jgi:hypothetical protein
MTQALTIDGLREQFADLHMKISAMPNEGSVLFCAETALAIAIPDGDADRGYIAGLIFAHVFSDADRSRPASTPGLDRSYSDGAGRRFMLYAMPTAKRIALEKLDAAIAALPMVEQQ